MTIPVGGMYPDFANVDETLEALIAVYGSGTRDGVNPTAKQWRAFLEFPYDGELVTHHFAKYSPEYRSEGVQRAAEAYVAVTNRILPELGVHVHYAGTFAGILFGQEQEDWDFVGMIRSPNRAALLRALLHPDYVAVHGAREKMVTRYKVVMTYPPFRHPAPWKSNE